jgi:hypothetical protein
MDNVRNRGLSTSAWDLIAEEIDERTIGPFRKGKGSRSHWNLAFCNGYLPFRVMTRPPRGQQRRETCGTQLDMESESEAAVKEK